MPFWINSEYLFKKKIVLLKNPDPYAVQEQVSIVTLVRPESTFVIALHAGQSWIVSDDSHWGWITLLMVFCWREGELQKPSQTFRIMNRNHIIEGFHFRANWTCDVGLDCFLLNKPPDTYEVIIAV